MKRRIRIGLRHLAPSFCQCRKWQKKKNLSIYIFPLPLLLYHPDLYHCQGSIEEKWQNFLEWKVEILNVYGKNFKCRRPDCNRRRIDCLIRKSTSHVDWASEGDGKDGTRYMEDTRNVSTNGQLSFYKTMPLPWPGQWLGWWHGCIFFRKPKQGGVGGGKLRIRMRKVKDLVNNASILAIFSLKLYNFFHNFLKICNFFLFFCSLSLIFVFFPHFLQIFLSFLKIS